MASGLQSTRATARRPATSTRAPLVGAVERLGDWELVVREHAGPTTELFRARPITPERVNASGELPANYAIKRVLPANSSDSRAESFLRREARVGSSVNHPHLVPVLMAHVMAPPYYLVMPWLEGRTLSRDIPASAASTTRRALTLGTVLSIARQTAEALDALHAAGWMHGDVKPSNIMVSPVGHVTLIDLGFARRPYDADCDLDALTVGTPRYMSPEVFLSTLRPDIRSDLFSLGAIMYELLAGRAAYDAKSAEALVVAHRQDEPTALRELAPEVPREVADFVHRLLAKEPLRRPLTPAEVVAALTRFEIAQLDHEWEFDDLPVG